jgi:thymidine phosphorylase
VTVALGGEGLVLAGLAATAAEGAAKISRALNSGAAAERFGRMVRGLGGPGDLVANFAGHLARAPLIEDVAAPAPGFVGRIATRELGMAVVELGGGRRRANDRIDHAVGLDALAGIGQRVERGDPLARIHARDASGLEAARARVLAAYAIAETAPMPAPLIAGRFAA